MVLGQPKNPDVPGHCCAAPTVFLAEALVELLLLSQHLPVQHDCGGHESGQRPGRTGGHCQAEVQQCPPDIHGVTADRVGPCGYQTVGVPELDTP